MIGVNRAALERWLDERGIGIGPITDEKQLTGGTQNVMVRFRRSDRYYVLRRPPASARANSDTTMRREAMVLRALGDTPVPTPMLVAAEPDPSVLGAAFYVMEAIDGHAIGEGTSVLDSTPGAKQRLADTIVDGLAALATVDHRALGLADFGRPGSFLGRQVSRWDRQMGSYSTVRGYPGPGIDLEPLNGGSSTIAHCPRTSD